MQSLSKTRQRLQKAEAKFAHGKYSGSGRSNFVIRKGVIPIMISAPHAVNHYRDGQVKNADILTGALTIWLHNEFGCHIIYKARFSHDDPNYDSNDNEENAYQTALCKYIKSNDIKLLIDIHGASIDKPYAIELGTAPELDLEGHPIADSNLSLQQYPFIADLFKYSMEYAFLSINSELREIWKNRIFSASKQNTVTKYISSHTTCACMQVEINKHYRDLNNIENVEALLKGFSYVIGTLSNYNWVAKKTRAYRLWQSFSHKPQDKVGLVQCSNSSFEENEMLYVTSYCGETEFVRLHETEEKSLERMKEVFDSEGVDINSIDVHEYLFLTNRLISCLWKRDWIQGKETTPFLQGAPVLLYELEQERYKMGIVKADQVDNVSFSSILYQSKMEESSKYDYIVYNRFTDSRLFVDFSKADYGDNGRIKRPVMMLPLYFKDIMEYKTFPFKVVRKEELYLLLKRIEKDVKRFLNAVYTKKDVYALNKEILSKDAFFELCKKCHPNVEVHFKNELKEEEFMQLDSILSNSLSNALCHGYNDYFQEEVFFYLDNNLNKDEKDIISEIEKYYELYSHVDLLKIPKHPQFGAFEKFHKRLSHHKSLILRKTIGSVEYYMKVVWTNLTDDKNNVCRLSRNMMNLLGVSENDKVVVKFGQRSATVRVLEGEDYSDSQIGIPAPVRKNLGMNSINDIALVSRDMSYIFQRHSQEQTIAIIGTVLAVFQVIDNLRVGLAICLVSIPLILYFALNEERIKVR